MQTHAGLSVRSYEANDFDVQFLQKIFALVGGLPRGLFAAHSLAPRVAPCVTGHKLLFAWRCGEK